MTQNLQSRIKSTHLYLLLEGVHVLPQEIDLGRLGHVLLHHQRQERRLRALRVVDAAAVRHQPVRRHHQQKVLDNAPHRPGHVQAQQRLHDPVRVPVVELSKPTWKFK